MTRRLLVRFFLLLCVCACIGSSLSGCVQTPQYQGPHPGEASDHKGIIASLTQSGGMTGLNDTIQVATDGRLAVDTRSDGSRFRQLGRGEYARLKTLLGRFQILDISKDEQAYDGLATRVWAKGSGRGRGSEADGDALTEFLRTAMDSGHISAPTLPPNIPNSPEALDIPQLPQDPDGP